MIEPFLKFNICLEIIHGFCSQIRGSHGPWLSVQYYNYLFSYPDFLQHFGKGAATMTRQAVYRVEQK